MTNAEEKPRILCVDDEPAVLHGLRRQLSPDFAVTTVAAPRDALRVVEQSDPFAAVISDMRMPEIDGVAFLARVRRATPETPRILLTGCSDIGSIRAAINFGQIFQLLLKPCPRATLVGAVQAAVTHHQTIDAERRRIARLEETARGRRGGSPPALTPELQLQAPLASPLLGAFELQDEPSSAARAVEGARGSVGVVPHPALLGREGIELPLDGPRILSLSELVDRLRSAVRDLTRAGGAPVSWLWSGAADVTVDDRRLALLLRELLAESLRDARGCAVSVLLARSGASLVLEVVGAGVGEDAEEPARSLEVLARVPEPARVRPRLFFADALAKSLGGTVGVVRCAGTAPAFRVAIPAYWAEGVA